MTTEVAEHTERSTLSLAFDRSPVAMALVAHDARLHRVNDAMMRVTGRDKRDLETSERGRTVHPDDVALELGAVERIREGSSLERLRVRAPARQRILELTLVRVEDDPDVLAIAYVIDVTELVEATEDVEARPQQDPSGAFTARAMLSLVEAMLRHANGPPPAVLAVGFERVQELRHHLDVGAFEDLLRDVSTRLAGIDPTLSIGRLGAESFVLAGPATTGADATKLMAQRVRAALRVELDASPLRRLPVRVGVAVSRPGDTAAELFELASDALDQAIADGEPVVHSSSDTPGRRQVMRSVGRTLPGAIDDGEISVVYQPIVDLQTDRIVAAEALARWDAAPRGVDTSTFVQVAEQTGLMPELGDHILDQAARGWAGLVARVGRPLLLHCNVSPRQLDPAFAERTLAGLDAAGLDPSLFVVELTEHSPIEHLEHAGASLDVLTDAGVKLAIDDFGTGHSWFNRLARVDPHIVKLDLLFSQHLATREGMRLAAAVVSAAKAVDAIVVAEGIAQFGQSAGFRQMGCDQGQGYFLGPPMTLPSLLGTVQLVS